MLSWLAAQLIGSSILADEPPPKPTFTAVQFGLAGPLFTGPAAGWPFRPGRSNWLSAVVHNPLDRGFDATPKSIERLKLIHDLVMKEVEVYKSDDIDWAGHFRSANKPSVAG